MARENTICVYGILLESWCLHRGVYAPRSYTKGLLYLFQIPLKRFYRYNLREALSFNEDGSVLYHILVELAVKSFCCTFSGENSAVTIFEDLPLEPIYTMGLDVPTSWLVRPREAFSAIANEYG